MEHDSLRQRPPVSPQWAIIVETGLVAEQKWNSQGTRKTPQVSNSIVSPCCEWKA